MEKYDIINCQRDGKPTSGDYVILTTYSDGKPRKIIDLKYWEKWEDEYKCLEQAMGLANDEYFPWVVVGKVDTTPFTRPHYKVIRKIKLMNAKRKEQGYAF